jgi:hypothetical protein
LRHDKAANALVLAGVGLVTKVEAQRISFRQLIGVFELTALVTAGRVIPRAKIPSGNVARIVSTFSASLCLNPKFVVSLPGIKGPPASAVICRSWYGGLLWAKRLPAFNDSSLNKNSALP